MSAFLITGATGRLGDPTVRLLAERGDSLLVTGRDIGRLRELEKISENVHALEVDVTEPAGAQLAAEECASRFGRVDGMVHLVGAFSVGPVMLTDISAYDGVMHANFRSAVVATQAVLPHLTGGAKLVYFTTPLADEPLAAMSAYAASKAALMAWLKSMAHEVKRRDIHANAVSLTLVSTAETRAQRPGLDLDQTVEAELVARAVGFLTSSAADGLYGSVLPVLGKFGFESSLAGPGGPGGGKR